MGCSGNGSKFGPPSLAFALCSDTLDCDGQNGVLSVGKLEEEPVYPDDDDDDDEVRFEDTDWRGQRSSSRTQT